MAQQTRISFEVSACELGIEVDELVRLASYLGLRTEGDTVSAEDQIIFRAFKPSEFCTRCEAAHILGVPEDIVQSLAEHESLPHAFCNGRMKLLRVAVKRAAFGDHQRQRELISAPRRTPVRMPEVSENATVAQAMAIEESPRKTTEPYVFWMLATMLAMAVGAIVYQSIWGHPPPG